VCVRAFCVCARLVLTPRVLYSIVYTLISSCSAWYLHPSPRSHLLLTYVYPNKCNTHLHLFLTAINLFVFFFFVWPLLPTHCKCRGHLFHLMTLSDTHHTRYDSSGRVISPTQRPVSDNTQHSQETHPYPRRDSNLQSSKRASTDRRAFDRAAAWLGTIIICAQYFRDSAI
jgi:hypothetical protein